MKINTTIWFGIIILSGIIIFFKNCDFQFNRKYLIEREFDNKTLQFSENNFVQSLDISTIYSDKLICTFNLENIDSADNNCKVTYFDINTFSMQDSFSFRIPKTAQIKYCQSEKIYFIDKFNLIAYSIKKKEYKKITPENFKCNSVTAVNTDILLVFGEMEQDGVYQTGYYSLNQGNNQMHVSKIIEKSNTSSAAPNSLIYSGKFTRLDTNVSVYYCDKFSKMYYFNNEGKFIREFNTIDLAPKPQLVSNGLAFFYKRGNTYNVNNGIVKNGDKLLVFSCRSKPVNYLIIDYYNFENGAYLNSTKLSYKDWTCQDIISISRSNNNLIMNFQDGVRYLTL